MAWVPVESVEIASVAVPAASAETPRPVVPSKKATYPGAALGLIVPVSTSVDPEFSRMADAVSVSVVGVSSVTTPGVLPGEQPVKPAMQAALRRATQRTGIQGLAKRKTIL